MILLFILCCLLLFFLFLYSVFLYSTDTLVGKIIPMVHVSRFKNTRWNKKQQQRNAWTIIGHNNRCRINEKKNKKSCQFKTWILWLVQVKIVWTNILVNLFHIGRNSDDSFAQWFHDNFFLFSSDVHKCSMTIPFFHNNLDRLGRGTLSIYQ